MHPRVHRWGGDGWNEPVRVADVPNGWVNRRLSFNSIQFQFSLLLFSVVPNSIEFNHCSGMYIFSSIHFKTQNQLNSEPWPRTPSSITATTCRDLAQLSWIHHRSRLRKSRYYARYPWGNTPQYKGSSHGFSHRHELDRTRL